MQIKSLTTKQLQGRQRVEADIVWEEVDRPNLRLYAEVDSAASSAFTCDPNAFLVACAVPAWQAGERRIAIEEELCPVLRDRMQSVFATLKTWYPELGREPLIESLRSRARAPSGKQTAS